MRLTFLLTSLVACTFATAIPLGNDISKEKTPSKTDQNPSKPDSTKGTASAHPSTLTVAGPYACPPKQYKACCMSLEETSKELMHPVGELVPIVGGIAISSQVSFQCNAMDPLKDPHTCSGHGYTPMCCENSSEAGVKANAVMENQGAAMNACQPFEKAKINYYKSLGYNKDEESDVDLVMDVMS